MKFIPNDIEAKKKEFQLTNRLEEIVNVAGRQGNGGGGWLVEIVRWSKTGGGRQDSKKRKPKKHWMVELKYMNNVQYIVEEVQWWRSFAVPVEGRAGRKMDDCENTYRCVEGPRGNSYYNKTIFIENNVTFT